jgi:hypothetical protein
MFSFSLSSKNWMVFSRKKIGISFFARDEFLTIFVYVKKFLAVNERVGPDFDSS